MRNFAQCAALFYKKVKNISARKSTRIEEWRFCAALRKIRAREPNEKRHGLTDRRSLPACLPAAIINHDHGKKTPREGRQHPPDRTRGVIFVCLVSPCLIDGGRKSLAPRRPSCQYVLVRERLSFDRTHWWKGLKSPRRGGRQLVCHILRGETTSDPLRQPAGPMI